MTDDPEVRLRELSETERLLARVRVYLKVSDCDHSIFGPWTIIADAQYEVLSEIGRLKRKADMLAQGRYLDSWYPATRPTATKEEQTQ